MNGPTLSFFVDLGLSFMVSTFPFDLDICIVKTDFILVCLYLCIGIGNVTQKKVTEESIPR